MILFYVSMACPILAIIMIHILDKWSTKTLLQYTYTFVNNKEFRNKIIEEEKKKGVFEHELNPLPRYFFKKIGINKGMLVMDLVFFVPLLIYFTIAMYYYLIIPHTLMLVATFLFGMLIVQIVRAIVTVKKLERLNLEMDVIKI